MTIVLCHTELWDPHYRIPRATWCVHANYMNNTDVVGVTMLNEKIYVVFRGLEVIVVYSLGTSIFESTIHVPGLTQIMSLTSCSVTNCLYFSFADLTPVENVRIWRVTLKGTVIKWKGTSGGQLSASRGHVVAVDNSVLSVYSSEGYQLKELYNDKVVLFSAVETASDKFVAVCKQHTVQGNAAMVVVLDSGGNIIRSCQEQLFPVGEILSLPTFLEVTLDDAGRVFVADWVSQRVLLLGSDLEFIRVLLTAEEEWDDINVPRHLNFNAQTGELLTLTWTNRLNVYKV